MSYFFRSNIVQPGTLRTRLSAVMTLAGFLTLAALAAPAHAQFGTNLIVNPDAEAGAANADGSLVPVPGWTTVTGNFTAVQYGVIFSFPTPTSPGPPDRGSNFFAGGPNSDSSISRANQVIDVSAGAPQIDTGATYSLSGFLGGFSVTEDSTVLNVTFRDALNATLGTGSIGPVTATDRGGETGLLLRSTNGTVPVGTRNILVELVMTNTNGLYNDAYADSLNLTLTSQGAPAAPEPTSLALLALGVGGILVRRERRRRSA